MAIFRVRVAFKCLACSSLRCKARPATSPQGKGRFTCGFFANHLTGFFLGGCQVKLSCGFGLVVWVFLKTLYFDRNKTKKNDQLGT